MLCSGVAACHSYVVCVLWAVLSAGCVLFYVVETVRVPDMLPGFFPSWSG